MQEAKQNLTSLPVLSAGGWLERIWQPALVAAVIYIVYVSIVALRLENPFQLVSLGTDFAPAGLQAYTVDGEGYDGQFSFYIARYGWQAEPYLDVPAYRFQRILQPTLAGLVSFGDDGALLLALITINGLSFVGIVVLMAWWLRHFGFSPWIAVAVSMSAPLFAATRILTTEAPAYALALLTVTLVLHHRYGWGVLALALAGLTKEPTLLFAIPLAFFVWRRRSMLSGAVWFVLACAPYGLLQIVLYSMLGEFGAGSGGQYASGFELIPYNGLFRIFAYLDTPLGPRLIFTFVLMFVTVAVPSLLAIAGIVNDYLRRKADIWTYLLMSQVLIIPFTPFSTFAETWGMFRFITGSVIIALLYAAARGYRRAVLYSAFWMVTLILLLGADF